MCVWQRAQGRTCRSVIPMTGRTDRRRCLTALQGGSRRYRRTASAVASRRWSGSRKGATASRIWLRVFSGAESGRTIIIRASICGRPGRRRIFIWPISALRTAMRTGRSLRRSVSGSSYISRGGRPRLRMNTYFRSVTGRIRRPSTIRRPGRRAMCWTVRGRTAARCASHHIPQRSGVTTIRIPEQ